MTRLSLDDAVSFARNKEVDLIALDDALNRLAEIDTQQSRIVEMRFFGGLTIEEITEALSISHATVERDWRMAKSWLRRELSAL